MLDGLRTIFAKLNGSLFGRPDEGEPVTAAEIHVPAPQPEPRDFESRLRALDARTSASGRAMVAGSIEVVGLEDIRAAMGRHWPEVAAEALDIAEEAIGSRLGEDDFFRRQGDSSFVLCFANLLIDEARARADEIAADIRDAIAQRFPDAARSLRVEPFVTEIARSAFGRDGATTLVESLCNSLAAMRQEAQQAARRYRASLVNSFNIGFAPAIHARSRVTIYNRAILETSAGCTTLAQFQALADPEQYQATVAELDYLALTKALAALHKALRNRGGVIILVPVNYSTLAETASQDEYARLLDMLPPAYKRLVGLEVLGLPPHAAQDKLVEIVERLRPHVKWLAFEVPSLEGRTALLGIEGVWALSCNLAGANSVDPRLSQRLREFVATASASKLSTLAHGANSIGAALAACEAGFTCVDGPAIQAASDVPRIASAAVPQMRDLRSGAVRRW